MSSGRVEEVVDISSFGMATERMARADRAHVEEGDEAVVLAQAVSRACPATMRLKMLGTRGGYPRRAAGRGHAGAVHNSWT